MSIGRAEFLEAGKVDYTVVNIDGLGDVRLRNLSAIEVESLRTDSDNPLAFGLRAIIESVVDDAGEQVLQPDDVDAVGRIPMGAITQLIEAISDLNGFGDVDDLMEDLDATPPEDSSTSLPES